MDRILITYYENNAKKLHQMVDKILLKFGGLSDKDMDDFYSLANEVFVEAMKRYDDSQSFEAFLYSCLLNKIKTEMTKRNREKKHFCKNESPHNNLYIVFRLYATLPLSHWENNPQYLILIPLSEDWKVY